MKPIKLISILLVLISATCYAGNARYVNLFMGTAGDHGQVSPAAQMPLGLVSAGPDCIAKGQHTGYDFNVTEISGFSVTRISGVGGDGTGGNLRIRPARKNTVLKIIKERETARPGYYETGLDNGVNVKLSVTPTMAIEKYSFPENSEKILFIDFNSAIDPRRSACSFKNSGEKSFAGWVRTSTVCNFGEYRLFFCIETDKQFSIESQDGTGATLRFPDKTRSVEVRIALSPIDENTASAELAELSGKSMAALTREAGKAWDKVLDKVDVSGSTEEQKALFYTSLYRLYLSPMKAMSEDGRYRGTDGEIHEADDWTYYSSWSMWDTYRTKFPMFCLIDQEAMSDVCKSLTSLFRTGKKNWATMQECVPTVRTEHSQVVLLDAWSKGVRDFDMGSAFPGMEKEYELGLQPGSRQGLTRNSPDQRMETIYDLWALGRIAEVIGDTEKAAKYSDEAEELFEKVWKEEFMDITGKFELMRGNGLYQGTRWQYRWAVPVFHGKMSLWHGKEKLAEELDEFFRRHLFNQGNEPDIQTPFMFNLFGHPEKTDSLVHALLTDEKYIHRYGGNAEYPQPFIGRAFKNTVDGYAPEMDEDDGAMSAWYMFCQMGLYPLCVGSDEYELFTPLFSKIILHLPGGDVKIVRKCKEGRAPSRITVDGKPLEGRTITHAALVEASEIVFE